MLLLAIVFVLGLGWLWIDRVGPDKARQRRLSTRPNPMDLSTLSLTNLIFHFFFFLFSFFFFFVIGKHWIYLLREGRVIFLSFSFNVRWKYFINHNFSFLLVNGFFFNIFYVVDNFFYYNFYQENFELHQIQIQVIQ